MRKFIISLFITLLSPLAIAAVTPLPLFCPELITCANNMTTQGCIVQGQYAANWGAPKIAGAPLIKGVYTFDSAWVKYVNGRPVTNECYFINKTSSVRYLSVSNKARPGFVAVPLSASWQKVPGREEIVKCQGTSFFQCPLLINP